MKTAIALLLVLVVFSPAWGQSYTIRTIAGGGLPGDIPALLAGIGRVGGVAADADGNVYLTLDGHNVIMRLDSAGMLTRLAGNGTYGYSGDNGPATGGICTSRTQGTTAFARCRTG